jgi:hypothetical protein
LAGEIAQEVAVALALSSAAIGAGGSVLSQIVGGVIVSRREKKKAEADERRWHIEADAKRRDRSLDHKIELFSRFLAALEGIQRAEAWGSPVSHQDFMAHNQTLDEAQQVLEEIGLIAPDVYRHANATHRSVTTMLFTKVHVGYPIGHPVFVTGARNAEETLRFWMGQTRVAIRSYINHEPVAWPEQALAELKLAQRQANKDAEEAAKTWSAPSASTTPSAEDNRV